MRLDQICLKPLLLNSATAVRTFIVYVFLLVLLVVILIYILLHITGHCKGGVEHTQDLTQGSDKGMVLAWNLSWRLWQCSLLTSFASLVQAAWVGPSGLLLENHQVQHLCALHILAQPHQHVCRPPSMSRPFQEVFMKLACIALLSSTASSCQCTSRQICTVVEAAKHIELKTWREWHNTKAKLQKGGGSKMSASIIFPMLSY